MKTSWLLIVKLPEGQHFVFQNLASEESVESIKNAFRRSVFGVVFESCSVIIHD